MELSYDASLGLLCRVLVCSCARNQVLSPTNSDCLALVSTRAVLAATMLRIKYLLRGIIERLLATGQRLNTSPGRACKNLGPSTTAVEWLRL